MSDSIRDVTTRLTLENERANFAECGVLARTTALFCGRKCRSHPMRD
jgi:hypothetical protein